jgi:plasmid stability protein
MSKKNNDKLTVVQVSAEFHRKLKIRAAELKKTVKDLMDDILIAFFMA